MLRRSVRSRPEPVGRPRPGIRRSRSEASRGRASASMSARIRAGDAGAEEELYERHRRGLAIILDHKLGSGGEVDDLLQETFRLALEKIRGGELRESARLPQFLNSLARNLAIHHCRREGRRRGDEDFEAVGKTFEIRPGQLDRVCRKEQAALALRVLAGLRNRRDRELLYRFYIAEEEKAEICGDFRLSSLHFNRVLHRARQRYREHYEKVAGNL